MYCCVSADDGNLLEGLTGYGSKVMRCRVVLCFLHVLSSPGFHLRGYEVDAEQRAASELDLSYCQVPGFCCVLVILGIAQGTRAVEAEQRTSVHELGLSPLTPGQMKRVSIEICDQHCAGVLLTTVPVCQLLHLPGIPIRGKMPPFLRPSVSMRLYRPYPQPLVSSPRTRGPFF